MPFDQFILEQLAGDELVASPSADLTETEKKRLIATGFLRMAPDGTGSGPDDLLLAKNAVVTETINIVTTSLMGMTVGCAQCHDHRFDPILHKDYYQLRAIFEPALDPKNWKTPSQSIFENAKQQAQKQAVSSFCMVLLGSNRFLYID